MYTSFTAKNFRCFEDMTIEPLARVNLICGENGAGKTTLLEALFIHSHIHNPRLMLDINSLRGLESVFHSISDLDETPWDFNFRKFNTKEKISFIGNLENIGHCSQEFRILYKEEELEKIIQEFKKDFTQEPFRKKNEKVNYSDNQTISTSDDFKRGYIKSYEGEMVLELNFKIEQEQDKKYLIVDRKGIYSHPSKKPPIIAAYRNSFMSINNKDLSALLGDLIRVGKRDLILKFLKAIKPEIDLIETITRENMSIIYGHIGLDRPIPLHVMGGGIMYLLYIICFIYASRNGIALIDEIENGFHHSIMDKVWKAIGEAAKEFNTQIFATTHSWECIVAAHKAFSESKDYDFRLHRLDMVNDKIKATTYDQETLSASIEIGMDVR